jgi:aminoglycoside 3-N-acetyltransferase
VALFVGCLIDESLADHSVLVGWKPFAEKLVSVPDDPDATVWHVRWYQLEEKALLGRLDGLAAAMLPTWYGHFWSGNLLCVILAGRCFWIPAAISPEWEEMMAYGEEIGIDRGWTSKIPTVMPDWVADGLAASAGPSETAPLAPEPARPSGEAQAVAQVSTPSTRSMIATALRAGGLRPGMQILVHSRLSALGWVAGGPVTVIQALQDAVTPEGTLLMPAFSTNLSDPAHWSRPPVPQDWWPTIRREMPPFDPLTTPTRGVGRIPELFRTWPDVLRSSHPHLSFSAWGREAAALTTDHRLTQGLGEDSPLGRLCGLDGWTLFLGTDFQACTALHLSEHRSGVCMVQRQGAPVMTPSGPRWQEWETLAYDDEGFPLIGLDYQLHAKPGEILRFKVGAADCLLLRIQPLVDFGAQWLRVHRGGGA